jgi:hypothetical protein
MLEITGDKHVVEVRKLKDVQVTWFFFFHRK